MKEKLINISRSIICFLLIAQCCGNTQFDAKTLFDHLKLIESHKGICTAKLLEMAKNPLGETAINFLAYSGKTINDAGNYHACMNSTKSYYFLMLVMENVYFAVRFGLCLPKECSLLEMEAYKAPLAQIFEVMLGQKLTEESILFKDVQEYSYKEGGFGIGQLAFWAFCGVFIVLTIVGSIVEKYREKSPNSVIDSVLQCFSFQKNLNNLTNNANKVDPNLDVFNGIRVISMCWIILGHCHEIQHLSPSYDVAKFMNNLTFSFFMTYIHNANLAVDIFFFLSGFFAASAFMATFKDPRRRNIKFILIIVFEKIFLIIKK